MANATVTGYPFAGFDDSDESFERALDGRQEGPATGYGADRPAQGEESAGMTGSGERQPMEQELVIRIRLGSDSVSSRHGVSQVLVQLAEGMDGDDRNWVEIPPYSHPLRDTGGHAVGSVALTELQAGAAAPEPPTAPQHHDVEIAALLKGPGSWGNARVLYGDVQAALMDGIGGLCPLVTMVRTPVGEPYVMPRDTDGATALKVARDGRYAAGSFDLTRNEYTDTITTDDRAQAEEHARGQAVPPTVIAVVTDRVTGRRWHVA